MINLHKRMMPDPAGTEPVTWSPVGLHQAEPQKMKNLVESANLSTTQMHKKN